jgi:guanylate kinase
MQARVSKAGYELSFKHSFDNVIVNDDFKKACEEAERAVLAFLE